MKGYVTPRPAKLSAAMVDALPGDAVIQCTLPPHRDAMDFASVEGFEVHYAKEHSNRCSSCGKNFPTGHFLALHIDEHHNTFREALQSRGEKTYGCFVEGCDKKCSNPEKRRLHLIDKHLLPKIYNFRIVDTGIDKSTSMLHESRRIRVSTTEQAGSNGHRRRQSQASKPRGATPASSDPGRSTSEVSDAAIKNLETSISALQFVPPQVRQRNKHHPV